MSSLSCIIPTFNNLSLLKRCLKTINNQITFVDQVIVVVDGSCDGTYEYLKKNYKDNNVYTILFQNNSGPGIARNLGLEYCNSEYVWFIDSDDYINKNAIKNIKQILKNKKYDLLYFNYRMIFSQNKSVDSKLNLIDNDKIQLFLTEQFSVNKVIRKKLLSKVNYPNIKINYEDHATMPALISLSKKIGYTDQTLYYYDYSHENNISKDLNQTNDMYFACDYLLYYNKNRIIKNQELETVFIKTFVFSRLYQPMDSIKNKYIDIKKSKKYLEKNLPNWKNSQCLSFKFSKKYSNMIKQFRFRILMGKLFKRSSLISTIVVYSLIMIKKYINKY